jgi:hypothetical protein
MMNRVCKSIVEQLQVRNKPALFIAADRQSEPHRSNNLIEIGVSFLALDSKALRGLSGLLFGNLAITAATLVFVRRKPAIYQGPLNRFG